MTNEELSELEQEYIAEEEAREQEIAEEKGEPPRKFSVKGLTEALQTSANSLKSLKTRTSTPKGFLS